MLDIWQAGDQHRIDLENFLELVRSNGVVIFQPPKSVGSGRARKTPETYLKANEWLDKYMREQNLWAAIKGKSIVKPCYRKFE